MAGLLRKPSGPFLSGDPASCDMEQWGNQPTAGSDAIAAPRLASSVPFSPLLCSFSPATPSSLFIPSSPPRPHPGRLGVGKGSAHLLLQSWAPGLRGYCLSREGPATLTPLTPSFSQAQEA